MFKSYELLNKTSVNVNVKIFQKNITPYLCSSFNFIVTSTKSFLLILTFEISLVLFVDCETLITRQGVPRGPVYNFLIEIIIYQKAFLPAPSPSRGLNWQTHCYNWEGKSYPKSEFLVTPIALPGIYF